MKEFKHETGNTFGDYVEAELLPFRGKVALWAGNSGKRFGVLVTRSGVTAIIAGLTAIRDAMPEEPR